MAEDAALAQAAGIDVYVADHACTALTTADAAVASNVEGLQDGYTDIVEATTGTPWHVCVTATGDKTDVRLDIPSLTLTSKQVATLVLTKSIGGVLMNGLLVNQQGALTA